ncbi:MAG: DoxX family protein [Cytophagales bacterium]|tara:strand:- start:1769 stop:2143 length:375 start_codon:yes stop_codon:yes gene_type:complete
MKVIIAKYILIIISSIFYVLVGIKHFIDPNFFLAIVPPYLPYHLELVYISGLFEILFGVMILFPKYRYWGSVGLIILLIAVFPANIYLFQSVEAQKAIGATQEIATWRLPVQGIFILVAYWIRK